MNELSPKGKHLALVFVLNVTLGAYQVLQFERVPTSLGVFDINCAIIEFDNGASRGIRFDPHDNVCESLSEDWFSNPTQDGNSSYLKLAVLETFFEPTKQLDQKMPIFSIGSSFVLFIRTGTIENTGSLQVDVKQGSGSAICYHFNAKFDQDKAVYNSFQGFWGFEIPTSNPITDSNSMYRLEFRYTAQAMELYGNDSFVQAFQHRISMSVCDILDMNITSDFVDGLGLQYYFPV